MRKIIITGLAVICATAILFVPTFAEESSDLEKSKLGDNSNETQSVSQNIIISSVDDIDLRTDIQEIGRRDITNADDEKNYSTSVKKEILLDHTAFALYATYDDPAKALETIREECSDLLDFLRKIYNLPEFSEKSWKKYYNCVAVCLDDEKNDRYSEGDEEVVKLNAFFDIYENVEINNRLIKMACEADSVESLMENDEFYYNLPYYVIDDMGRTKLQSFVRDYSSVSIASFTLGNTAYTYAKNHAESPNRSEFPYYIGRDCANFASQILYKGGKKQNQSWYCKKKNGVFQHSNKWTVANDFAKYWGVDKKYTSHKTFSASVKKGDFITYDRAGDGGWDHIGFIPKAPGEYDAAYGYTLYYVAQHSSNYYEPVSSKKNGWENLRADNIKCVYGIIRIN